MNEEEEEVVLLDREVVYLEPEVFVDDGVGFDDETAEYMLGEVDNDYDEVVLEPEEILLLDTMRVDTAELEVA